MNRNKRLTPLLNRCSQLGASVSLWLVLSSYALAAQPPELKFDHIHTFKEVASYLQKIQERYSEIAALHTIGESYLGKDLLVLEITNRSTGPGLEKPGLFIDGNLHSDEVFGGEVCLSTIQTLVTGYGVDPLVTELVDTRVYYIMPKLNPDGSDHAITKPDGLRSVVRPFDDDDDGLDDEDPPEDLNGDGYITRMRVREMNGPQKTSSEDPRLMVPAQQGSEPGDWNGEWRVYTEGIDNDGDGRFNEDGVGGIDINRNFPEQWQPAPISFNPGSYPLSELESRAVADFLLSRPNLTGLINYHMSGNVVVYPPSNLRTDPITGDVVRQPYEDELTYERLGGKADELIEDVKVQVFKIHGASPATWHGSIWGVYVDWVYYRLGIFAWIFEVGVYPGVTDIFPSYGKPIERLRWSDEHMDGRLFLDWQAFDHPQLGKVEIGGFLNKIYDPRHETYTNVMCLPGPDYEKQLADHTKWHLYLMSQSPLVKIKGVEVTSLAEGLYKVEASVQNDGYLPTHVTQQALGSGTAKTVVASIALEGADVVSGEETIDLGHLPGKSSPPQKPCWVVQARARNPTAVIRAVSEKGGTDRKKIVLN
jgi:hypothetical protein